MHAVVRPTPYPVILSSSLRRRFPGYAHQRPYFSVPRFLSFLDIITAALAVSVLRPNCWSRKLSTPSIRLGCSQSFASVNALLSQLILNDPPHSSPSLSLSYFYVLLLFSVPCLLRLLLLPSAPSPSCVTVISRNFSHLLQPHDHPDRLALPCTLQAPAHYIVLLHLPIAPSSISSLDPAAALRSVVTRSSCVIAFQSAPFVIVSVHALSAHHIAPLPLVSWFSPFSKPLRAHHPQMNTLDQLVSDSLPYLPMHAPLSPRLPCTRVASITVFANGVSYIPMYVRVS